MSIEFILCVLSFCAILYIPGSLILGAFGLPKHISICCAPLITITGLCILGQIYAWTKITANLVNMLVPVLLIGVAFMLFSKVVLKVNVFSVSYPSRISKWLPILCMTLGLGIAYNLFVSRLPSENALFQAYDLTQHLNSIQAMSESGYLSSFNVSAYLTAADAAISPVDYATFYPSAYHILCVLVVWMTKATVPVVINASMYVCVGIVYPLSMCAFLETVFDGALSLRICGAVGALSFAIYPWALLAFGPVWPNYMGFAVMPSIMTVFAQAIHSERTVTERIKLFVIFMLMIPGLVLLHPNIIFSSIVILSPLCVSNIWYAKGLKDAPKKTRFALCIGFIMFCVGFWIFCYKLPLFQDTVSHYWKTYARSWQEIINLLSQTYVFRFFGEIATQFVLGIIVVIGLIKALHTPKYRWIAASWGLAALICYMGATAEGDIKHLFSGFWYNDPMRVAAMASIAAVPLAALGLEWVYELIVKVVDTYNRQNNKHTHPLKIAVICTCAFLVVNFAPDFSLPGLHYAYTEADLIADSKLDFRDWAKSVHTTFGDIRSIMVEVYNYDTPLEDYETEFLDMVKETVGEGELILNDPMDGSFLAYGFNGLHVYYRSFLGFTGTAEETYESELIRTSLCDIATNSEVLSAVQSLGAKYVVVLSQAESEYSLINTREDYDPDLFLGVGSITSKTQGFTLMYRTRGCSLYRIDAAFE